MFGLYVFCLAVGAFYAIVSALFGAFGFGHGHGGADGLHAGGLDHHFGTGHALDTGHSHAIHNGNLQNNVNSSEKSSGPAPWNPLVIGSAITVYGAFGILGMKTLQIPEPYNAMLAGIAALAVGTAVFFGVVKVMYSLQSNTLYSREALAGTVGTVITPVPERGLGEVAYIANGARFTAPAKSSDGSISKGSKVIILAAEGKTLLIARAIELQEQPLEVADKAESFPESQTEQQPDTYEESHENGKKKENN